MKRKLLIIGSGPAGLTAGIYAGRAGLEPLLIDGLQPGGQLTTTTTVENWPGEKSIGGTELMMRMRSHAQACGVEFMNGVVTEVDFSGTIRKITLHNGTTIEAEAVIIANGSSHKKLGVPGEKEYFGKGVTVCATCDAPFYKDLPVVVVGGGNSGVTEAEHLTHFASSLTILQIMPELTATDPIKDKVVANEKSSVICNAQVTKIVGNGTHVTAISYTDLESGEEKSIETRGVFVAIGLSPNTAPYQGELELTQFGHIVCEQGTQTSAPGVFAAGDIADPTYQQAITSAGEGCKAALDAQRYLAQKSL